MDSIINFFVCHDTGYRIVYLFYLISVSVL